MPGPSILDRCAVIPVVVIHDLSHAIPMGEALLAGGIAIAEITLRTPVGLDAIRLLAAELPDLHVGAGSVLTPGQVGQVADAGGAFVVSPGLSVGVVHRAQQQGLPALPGVATASELMAAVALGLSEVKFFPAGILGGPDAIRALAAPFSEMRFMPSGGVNAANMTDYLRMPVVPAISGSWMVDPALLADGLWNQVTALSAAAVTAAEQIKTQSQLP